MNTLIAMTGAQRLEVCNQSNKISVCIGEATMGYLEAWAIVGNASEEPERFATVEEAGRRLMELLT